MKLKIAELGEKQLKDFLLACTRIKSVPDSKLDAVLAKYAESSGTEREDLQRLLIESNLKSVVCIANRYRGASLSFAALIRHGNSGLIAAVKNWNGSGPEDFMEYLAWAIEGAVLDALVREKKEGKGV